MSNTNPCSASLLSDVSCGSEASEWLGSQIVGETVLEHSNFSNDVSLYEPSIKLVSTKSPISVLYVNIDECKATVDTLTSTYGNSNFVKCLSLINNVILTSTHKNYLCFENSHVERTNFCKLNKEAVIFGSGTMSNCWIDDTVLINDTFSISGKMSNPTVISILNQNILLPTERREKQHYLLRKIVSILCIKNLYP